MNIAIESISHTRDTLTINWSDNRVSALDCLWLRDHCQMPESRDPLNGQRLINVTDLPEDLSIARAHSPNGVQIEVQFAPDGHTSSYSRDWLRQNCYCLNQPFDDRSARTKLLWAGDTFSSGLPQFDYDSFVKSSVTKVDMLETFSNYGFARLTHVPCVSGQVIEAIEQVGFVRHTNYGEMFEVKSVANPTNLAFTNLGLGCHTDNPYRDPVPTVQFLHCLKNSASGGDSVFVDGFYAARLLCEENPTHFSTLVDSWVNFRFTDERVDLRSRVPMIEVDDAGQVVRVRFNNRSISTLILPPEKMRSYYEAYRHFAQILERDALKISMKLTPGDLVLFDNTRVMHARTAFAEDGERHLQGAYTDLDSIYSALNVVRREQRGQK